MNKAHAAGGGLSLSAAITIVMLWYFNLDPPAQVVVAIHTIVSAAITIPAVWLTPHKPSGA